jgi:hypothetical protein
LRQLCSGFGRAEALRRSLQLLGLPVWNTAEIQPERIRDRYIKGERVLRSEVIVHHTKAYRWGSRCPAFPKSSAEAVLALSIGSARRFSQPKEYGARRAAYGLKKFRPKGMVRKIAKSRIQTPSTLLLLLDRRRSQARQGDRNALLH